jgi:hypothetical protein
MGFTPFNPFSFPRRKNQAKDCQAEGFRNSSDLQQSDVPVRAFLPQQSLVVRTKTDPFSLRTLFGDGVYSSDGTGTLETQLSTGRR